LTNDGSHSLVPLFYSNLDFTRGLLQSIGFKEFNDYLQLEPEKMHSETGNKLFEDGLKLLKIATRQYAKRQLKWISQRFLRPIRRQVPPVYWLDGNLTDDLNWEKNVTTPSRTILESYLSNQLDLPLLTERRMPHKEDADDLIARLCEVCENRVMIGILQWEAHINGNKHKRAVKRRKALELAVANTSCSHPKEEIELPPAATKNDTA
jgi:tRNA dimethylallyltransferase